MPTMLATRIREVLRDHPHWGPMRVAEVLKTSARVISVVASREKIRFMDRTDLEIYTDGLREKLNAG